MKKLEKIHNYIGKGETEKAIKLLVEYTKETSSPNHDEAVLLLGQFRQWKRQKNLGIEQSDSDLRRIEVSIMDILQDKFSAAKSGGKPVETSTTAMKSTPVPKVAIASSVSSSSNRTPIFIGLALVLGLLGFWLLGSSNTSFPPLPPEPPIPSVNGKNVKFVSFGNGHLRHIENGVWEEESKDFKVGYTFTEEGRDDYSVYLFDKSRNVRLRPDLHTKKIMYKGGNKPEREQYGITKAYDKIRATVAKKVIYDYSGTMEGTFTLVPGTKTWLEDNPDSKKAGASKKLIETDRDEWTIYLEDEWGFALQLNLHEKKVLGKTRAESKYSQLYRIKKGI